MIGDVSTEVDVHIYVVIAVDDDSCYLVRLHSDHVVSRNHDIR